MARTNSFSGKCHVCNADVAAQSGYIDKLNGRWVVYCTSSKCLPAQLQTSIRTDEVRELTADGLVLCPRPDSAGIALIKGCAKARWCPKGASNENPNTGKPVVVPEGREGVWVVSVELRDRPRTIHMASKLGLKIAQELLARVLHPKAEEALTRASRPVQDPSTKATLKAYPYQVGGASWLAPMPYAILGDDMGLGKTPQALLALDASMGTLIIVPASVKLNWRRECLRWRPELDPVVLSGRDAWTDPHKWPAPGEVWILNADILPDWLKPTLEITVDGYKSKVADVDDETKRLASNVRVVADEAHLYKNYKAARSQKMTQLNKLVPSAWGLTGTPLENHPFDLWGVLSVFNVARDVFGSFNGFVRCFNGYKSRWGGYEFGGPTEDVPERLRRIMIRRLKSEVLKDLPPKTYSTLEVEINNARLRRDLDSMYGNYGELLESDNLPDFQDFSAIRAALAEDRIPAMLEVVESHEDAGEPLLVFSYHQAPVKALADREGWAVITGGTSNTERDRIVEDFQAGRLKGVGLTIRAAGVGLTLTHAKHSLFVDLDWVPTWNIQAEDRIHRIGQVADHVQITRMVSNHSLDLHVQRLLLQKMALIKAAIEATHAKASFVNAGGPGITLVSDEEHAKRLEALRDAEREAIEKVEREAEEKRLEAIKGRIPQWLERARVHAKGSEKPITSDKATTIRQAYSYMVSVCDGANEKDNVGFNKPDASIASLVLRVDPGLADEDTLRLAERVLTRYPRQLSGSFPDLFKKVS